MPWWRNNRRDAGTVGASDAAGQELATRAGDNPCTAAGCTATTGLPCEYVDRRERRCRTAWCPAHRVVVDGHVYCRRHAGVVAALASAGVAQNLPFPDLDNRAPSLVAWVAKQIDADVWQLMLQESQHTGGQLVSDAVSLVFVGIDRQRAWERAWAIALFAGDRRRVSLLVEETHDAEVVVKVGSNVVDRVTPPWIVHRERGDQVSDDQDRAEREAFDQRVLDAMARGLARERELAVLTEQELRAASARGAEVAG